MSWHCQLLRYFLTKWKDFVLITLLPSWVLPPRSLEPFECFPVKLKDQIYSLCRWVNLRAPRRSYIYFIYLNMKYTFYRCFTLLLSVHGSPKYMCQRDTYNGLQPSWVRMGFMMRRPAQCEGPATAPTFVCLALTGTPARTAHIKDAN